MTWREILQQININFKQELKNLEDIAGSMPILSEKLTGYKNIRKINVRNYVIFYMLNEENSKALVLRIGHTFMDWEKYLKDEQLANVKYLLIFFSKLPYKLQAINQFKKS